MGGRKVLPLLFRLMFVILILPLLFRLMFVILIAYCLLSLLPHIFDLQYSNIKDRHGWVLQWHQGRIIIFYFCFVHNYCNKLLLL